MSLSAVTTKLEQFIFCSSMTEAAYIFLLIYYLLNFIISIAEIPCMKKTSKLLQAQEIHC